MIITLSGLLIQRRFKKREKLFGIENKVLTQEDIITLAESPEVSRTIQAFKSAVVNHDIVEYQGFKKRLYTSYPQNVQGLYPGAGHDGFRRAEIAYQIGNLADKLERKDTEEAGSVLETLTMENERKYTKILALNSLGIVGTRTPSVVKNMWYHSKKDLNDSSHYPIGALAFLEKIIGSDKDKITKMLKEATDVSALKNRMLLKYFMARNNLIPKAIELQNFLSNLSSYSKEDVVRGLELIELVGPRPPFMKHTPQARIYLHLTKECLNLIGVAGYIDRLNLKEDYEPPFRKKDSLIEQTYR